MAERCRYFPSTHWSLVARAGHDDAEVRRQALVGLLGRYLGPLKAHLTGRKRVDPHRADDLLQGFLLSRVLESDLLRRAEQERGRFRTFLLTALDRYVANQDRDRRARKRRPDQALSLEGESEPVSPDPAPPEAFETAWARQVLAEAIRRMRDECTRGGRGDVWGVFEARVLAPMLGDTAPPGNEDLAAANGLPSAARVSNILVTGKRMFARSLRSVIGEYERDEALIDAEVAELRAALSRGGGGRS